MRTSPYLVVPASLRASRGRIKRAGRLDVPKGTVSDRSLADRLGRSVAAATVPGRDAPVHLNPPNIKLRKYDTGTFTSPALRRIGIHTANSTLYTREPLSKRTRYILARLRDAHDLSLAGPIAQDPSQACRHLFNAASRSLEDFDSAQEIWTQYRSSWIPGGARVPWDRSIGPELSPRHRDWSLACYLVRTEQQTRQISRPVFRLNSMGLDVSRYCTVGREPLPCFLQWQIQGALKPASATPTTDCTQNAGHTSSVGGYFQSVLDHFNSKIMTTIRTKHFADADALATALRSTLLTLLPTSTICQALDMQQIKLEVRSGKRLQYREAVLVDDHGHPRDRSLTPTTSSDLSVFRLSPFTAWKFGVKSRVRMRVRINDSFTQGRGTPEWEQIRHDLELQLQTSPQQGFCGWLEALLRTTKLLAPHVTFRTLQKMFIVPSRLAARILIYFKSDRANLQLRLPDTFITGVVPIGEARSDLPTTANFRVWLQVVYTPQLDLHGRVMSERGPYSFRARDEGRELLLVSGKVLRRICQEMKFMDRKARAFTLAEALLRELELQSPSPQIAKVSLRDMSSSVSRLKVSASWENSDGAIDQNRQNQQVLCRLVEDTDGERGETIKDDDENVDPQMDATLSPLETKAMNVHSATDVLEDSTLEHAGTGESFHGSAYLEGDRRGKYVALGSNIGDRFGSIEAACDMIDSSGVMRIVETSPLYETEPMYVEDQERFLNGVCKIETELTPIELLDKLQEIENGLGRVKLIDKGPRNIDLDIVAFEEKVINTERLTVPHRLMLEREFVLRPLCDTDGQYFRHPVTGQLAREHLKTLPPSLTPMYPLTPLAPGLEPLRAIDPRRRTHVMSILNVTPDSFSDGGMHAPADIASLRFTAAAHIATGATIIDVGGQSSRPNASDISAEEEIARILPAIHAIRSLNPPGIAISVDTYRAAVAEAAVRAGAHIVNDVSAGTLDPAMLPTIARLRCSYVLMHMRGTPATMQSPEHTSYPDGLVPTVARELRARLAAAQAAGVRRWRIVLDPGLGFAKTAEQNVALLRDFAALRDAEGLGTYPWLVGSSRKGFIGQVTGEAVARKRLGGTAATVAAAVQGGADIVRVHDVKEMAQAVRMARAMYRSGHR